MVIRHLVIGLFCACHPYVKCLRWHLQYFSFVAHQSIAPVIFVQIHNVATFAGTHQFGPSWTALDGSTVFGAKLAAATPDASAIPWLLLGAVSHSGPTGVFSQVGFVQRLNTIAGKAPATGCDNTTLNTTNSIYYEADYYFYNYPGSTPAGWQVQPPTVPAALKTPANATLFSWYHGTGYQIYICTGAPTPAWILKTPAAQLFDSAGDRLLGDNNMPTANTYPCPVVPVVPSSTSIPLSTGQPGSQTSSQQTSQGSQASSTGTTHPASTGVLSGDAAAVVPVFALSLAAFLVL